MARYSDPFSSKSYSDSLTYDVFLSCGNDTRKNFADHLYTALEKQGIYTYRDDDTHLHRGSSPFKAIERSKIAVIVLSKNYAYSSSCLDELAYAMESKKHRGLTVLPIFYRVDPSDVRKRKGDFGLLFEEHILDNNKKYESWRQALLLVGNLAGRVVHRHESNCIKEIVDYISYRLHPLSSSNEDPIGTKIHIQDLKLSSSQSVRAPSSHSLEYDVYLSFSGEDTLFTFVDHLYTALEQENIYAYKDDVALRQGTSIKLSHLNAIKESKIVVIVFSKNYADSSWCLNELPYIMKCKEKREQTVLPIFYDVEPSEVRKQRGKFGEAFKKNHYEFQDDNYKVEIWRKALSDASNLAGLEVKNTADGYVSKYITEIVDTISRMLLTVLSSSKEDLTRLETHMQDLESKLENRSGGVRMVGIWGIGGGGKTTLATSIYNKISTNFEDRCFVENISEKSSKDGLISLQEKVLSDVMKQKVKLQNVREGKHMIKRVLGRRKVLIVLDDVDHIDHLNALAGSYNWFGDGSRIIITTRDVHVLNAHGVDVIHTTRLLDDDEAIELSSKHVFSDYNRSKKDYELLFKDVVSHASGLPSVLNIPGSILCYKDIIEWESALARLEKIKFSHDGLTPVELANELQYSYLENYRVLRLNGTLQKILWNYKYLLHLRCLFLSAIDAIVTTPDFGELPFLQVLTLHHCSSLEEIHPSLGHHARLVKLSVIHCHKLRMIPSITAMNKLKTLEILDCDALHEFPEVHAIIDRHWLKSTDTIAEFSRGLSSWASSYSIHAIYSQWRNHDVFLSFLGEYDSNTFVDHLCSTLIQQGINTYKSDKTPSHGDSIGLSIKNAIEESQIAIIIFTKNYAGSSRCLDELSYIMKCIDMRGLHVMPIFYDVYSSDVQKQKGEFGKEFDKQELENMAKVELWRKALKGACNHSGWSLKQIVNRNEGRYIKDIVATVSHRLFSLNTKVKKDLIGIRPRSKSLTLELAIESDDVRMVVVGGIGGSGKTTIASCVYMEISRQFEGRCFVENIREESRKYGIKKLQRELLSTILKKEVDVPSDEEGKRMIQSMLCDRKVLIVLDDVSDPHQLESLAGSHDWFGGGSRIIITSREGNVLSSKVDALYDVSLLSNDEAIKLFRRHAYPEYNPVDKGKWRPSSSFVEAYDTLSQDVISYANGLPLTLKFLGSFLYEKDKDEWVSTLAKLRDVSNPRIIDKLKISYDGLQPDEKELFLDIACFFRGASVDSLMMLLDAFSFHPFKRVNVLVKRSLITVSNGMFDMHDLVEEMAHHIVREEHPKHPQKHSRVWQGIDVAEICATNATEGINKIQGLYAPNYDAPPNLLKVVANMKNLRLLNVRQHVKEVAEEPLSLSNELRWISWENYPAISLPISFQPKMLFCLILRNGLQEVLWEGFKHLPRLKVLDLHGSKNLIMTPDFHGLPNLERLVLSGCSGLKEIDRSIGYHERLVYLNLDSCEKLVTFPPVVRMPKLETLILSRCFQLLKFPEIKHTMYGLQHLYMEYSGIEVVPSTVGQYCIHLVSINVIGCDNLKRIEGNFQLFKQRCVILVDARA